MEEQTIKKAVRKRYGKIARNSGSCCGPKANIPAQSSSCCGNVNSLEIVSKNIGYDDDEINSVPEGSNLGLGCGNPTAHASIKEGETVLDLGSGAGFDCFLAAKKVGETGKVIGVDMTQDMLDKARENAIQGNYSNVEFRLGEIENLPVSDNSVDLIISNCVINLSTNKERVFQEAYRVLKPGGRMFISDIVILEDLPEYIRDNINSYIGCVSGAVLKGKYLDIIKKAGFNDVEIQSETSFPTEFITSDVVAKEYIEKFDISLEQVEGIAKTIVSIKVKSTK